PVGVGSTFRAVGHRWGKDWPLEVRVTAHEAPRRFAFEASGPGEHYVHEFVLRPDGDGTTVERRFTMLRTPLAFRIAMPLIMRTVARRSTLRTLQNLKDRLEGTSASTPAR
ncbi:MAG: SRPBCC family protein, partial [Actinobacteria bacterium]|nr:SRPBCC family protein [Actinomycetota bacterium]